jgi:site-specific DNA recombinase
VCAVAGYARRAIAAAGYSSAIEVIAVRDTSARTEAAQARIADLDKKIAQYRASLDAGGGPAVIGPWIAETQAQKVAARAEIRSATGQRRMTRYELAALVAALGDLARSSATPTPPTRLTCTPS